MGVLLLVRLLRGCIAEYLRVQGLHPLTGVRCLQDSKGTVVEGRLHRVAAFSLGVEPHGFLMSDGRLHPPLRLLHRAIGFHLM